ncbi:MAG TPA: YkgJ family cysteine cluster protein [Bryobacteraceae bacterium]|nr:YkgJ family cysteine cluster protein [Bryobacteraceae bacterium]
MITDLVQIRRLAVQHREENVRFRAYFRRHRHTDRRLRKFAEEIEAEIDCTACANCCRVTEVEITAKDIEKLAKFLGASEQEFVEQFTALDESGKVILKRTESGCVFLQGNLCSVYEARPHNCANFPHLIRGAGSISSRLPKFLERASFCPIVYNWLERVKEDMGFR